MRERLPASLGRRALALGIGLALAGAAWFALRPRREAPHPSSSGPDTRPGTAAYRESDVAREIAALGSGHPWAGQYFRGNGFTSENVCLAPTSGWFRWTGFDVGPPFESTPETGALDLSGQSVRLERPREGTVEVKAAFEFVLVAWGERRYLVDRSEVADFCAEVDRSIEPRSHAFGRWLVRVDSAIAPLGSGGEVDRPEVCR